MKKTPTGMDALIRMKRINDFARILYQISVQNVSKRHFR